MPMPVALMLTKREREVFDMVRRRWTDREIATTLNISRFTVRAYVVMIAAKIGGAGTPREIIRRCEWPREAT